MKILHRHGPCSPLADARVKPPSHAEILADDQNRVESIQRRVSATTTGKLTKRATPVQPGPKKHSTSSSTPSLPVSSGRSLGTGNYVVTVGLGTPASPYTVVFDTGSDTTWVQCRPCVAKCYKQKQPLFDPAKSSTYANISCADPACHDLDQSGCTGGHCLYGLQYGDGSYSVGFFAKDTLTISHDAIKGFRFGCGEKNDGLFGKTAGLMGLGRGKTSLTVQAYDRYGGAFAYCLPASASGTTGYLDFGPGASPDADTDRQRADVLLRGSDGHPRGREAAAHPGVRLLDGRDAGGLRHGDHATPGDRLSRPVLCFHVGHGGARVQEGAGVLHPGHLLRLHGGQRGDAADGGAAVQGRRVPGRRRVRDPARHHPGADLPRVRVQRRRRQRRHPREHAAEDLRRGPQPRQEDHRLRPRCLLIDHLV